MFEEQPNLFEITSRKQPWIPTEPQPKSTVNPRVVNPRVVNPFADLCDTQEPLEQQPTPVQITSPEPRPEEKTIQIKDFMGPLAPVNDPNVPPRSGPLLWWQKDDRYLSAATRWHRNHAMSPAVGKESRESYSGTGPSPRRPQKSQEAEWYERNQD